LEASMRKMGVRATNETLTVLLSSLGRAGAVEEALRLAQRIRIDAESGGAVYDLPLYNALLQALLVGGNEADVTRVIELLRAAGHVPSTRTLNILLKGLVQTRGSLEAALEVFNSFCAAGGEPGVMSYNILLAGFAREGQLLNCEVLLSQLRQQGRHRAADDAEGTAPPEKLCQQEEEQRQEEEEEGAAVDAASRGSAVQGAAAAAGTGRPAGADVAAAMALPEDALAGCAVAQEGLRPDAYTYNALLLAALNSGRPGAAIAHRKLMLEDGVDADAVTLKLLVSAYTASERPLEGVGSFSAWWTSATPSRGGSSRPRRRPRRGQPHGAAEAAAGRRRHAAATIVSMRLAAQRRAWPRCSSRRPRPGIARRTGCGTCCAPWATPRTLRARGGPLNAPRGRGRRSCGRR
jgi:hypothetical protein